MSKQPANAALDPDHAAWSPYGGPCICPKHKPADAAPTTEAGRELVSLVVAEDHDALPSSIYRSVMVKRVLKVERQAAADATEPLRASLNWALSELMNHVPKSRAAEPMFQRGYKNARQALATEK